LHSVLKDNRLGRLEVFLPSLFPEKSLFSPSFGFFGDYPFYGGIRLVLTNAIFFDDLLEA